MEAFFAKFPMELEEKYAVEMIQKKIETAHEKCSEGDQTYITDLAKSYEMLEAFFDEKRVNPATLV